MLLSDCPGFLTAVFLRLPNKFSSQQIRTLTIQELVSNPQIGLQMHNSEWDRLKNTLKCVSSQILISLLSMRLLPFL